MPEYLRRQRQQRQMRIAVLAILALLVFPPPISPSQLVYAYFGAIFAPDVFGRVAMFISTAAGALPVAVLLLYGLHLMSGRALVPTWTRKTWVFVCVMSLVIGFGVMVLAATYASQIPLSVQSSDIAQAQGAHYFIGTLCILATVLFGFAGSIGWWAARIPSNRVALK